MTHAFTTPFARVVLTPKNGAPVPLWIAGSTAAGRNSSPTTFDQLPFMTSLTVDDNLGNVPAITATLSMPYSVGIPFLDSSLAQWSEATLSVQLGYTNNQGQFTDSAPVYEGLTLKPTIEIGANINYTFVAHGIGGFQLARVEVSTVKAKKRIDIIRELLAGVENATLNSESLAKALADPISAPLLQAEVPQFVPGGRTAIQLIWSLLRESQCWMTFRNKQGEQARSELHVVPRGSVNSRNTHLFSLFGSQGGVIGPNASGGGIYPILSVQSPTMAVYLPGGVEALTRGVSTKQSRGTNGAPQTQQNVIKATNASSGQGSIQPNGSTVRSAVADISSPGLPEQVKSEIERVRSSIGVNLEVQTLGVPDLIPGQVVAVDGLGQLLSGPGMNYTVFTVSHTYSDAGFTTRWTGVSNVFPYVPAGARADAPSPPPKERTGLALNTTTTERAPESPETV